jgi:hypothetical protein
MDLLAAACAELVAAAELPNRYSPRDGKLLKLVPAGARLGCEQLAARLAQALQQSADGLLPLQARHLLGRCGGGGGGSGRPAAGRRRAVAAWLRGLAYQQAGQHGQALAVRCSPSPWGGLFPGGAAAALLLWSSVPPPPSATARTQDARVAVAYAAAGCRLAAAAAHALLASAHQAAGSAPALAALHLQQAAEAAAAGQAPAGGVGEALAGGGSEALLALAAAAYTCAASQLLPSLEAKQQGALRGGGAAGLAAQLRAERQTALPEFLRPRPK